MFSISEGEIEICYFLSIIDTILCSKNTDSLFWENEKSEILWLFSWIKIYISWNKINVSHASKDNKECISEKVFKKQLFSLFILRYVYTFSQNWDTIFWKWLNSLVFWWETSLCSKHFIELANRYKLLEKIGTKKFELWLLGLAEQHNIN